jgi:hypothetical protein
VRGQAGRQVERGGDMMQLTLKVLIGRCEAQFAADGVSVVGVNVRRSG